MVLLAIMIVILLLILIVIKYQETPKVQVTRVLRFKVRLRNIKRGSELHKAGLRNGQFATLLKQGNNTYIRHYYNGVQYYEVTAQHYVPIDEDRWQQNKR